MESETGAQTLLLLVMLKRQIRNWTSATMGQQERNTMKRVLLKMKHLMRLNIRNPTISEMSEQLHVEDSWKENTLKLERSSMGKKTKQNKTQT